MSLTPYLEALKILEDTAADIGLLPFSTVPLKEAFGRVAASRIESGVSLPAFDNSAMDGFAVVSSETAQAPVELAVAGSISAGDAPPISTKASGAYEIMTGAPVPAGYDAVVRVEDVVKNGAKVRLSAPIETGAFVRRAGTDFSAGQMIAEAGTVLDERHLMALAALGICRVSARWKPKVGLIFTGRELVSPETTPAPGQIRNASQSYLTAALERLGAEVRDYGVVADDPADFKARLDAALSQENDLILTTGAVSMGRHDFIAESVAEMGAQVLFHKAAIRPGRPILAARFGHGPLLLGLPGNPISTAVGLRFFALPFLRKLLGQRPERFARARLEEAFEKPAELRGFFKAKLSGTALRILPGQGSFQIRPLLEANAWAILPEGRDVWAAGTEVEAAPLWPQE